MTEFPKIEKAVKILMESGEFNPEEIAGLTGLLYFPLDNNLWDKDCPDKRFIDNVYC